MRSVNDFVAKLIEVSEPETDERGNTVHRVFMFDAVRYMVDFADEFQAGSILGRT